MTRSQGLVFVCLWGECVFDFRLIWPQNRNEKDIEVRDRGVEFV